MQDALRFHGRSLLVAWLAVLAADTRAFAAESADPPRPDSHALAYGLALAVSQVRDDLLRPIAYRGAGPGVDLGYRFASASWELDITLHFDLQAQGSSVGAGAVGFLPGAHSTALVPLVEGRKVRLLLGGTYRYRSQIEYFYDWDDSFLYWMTAHMLGPTVRVAWPKTPVGDLSLEIELPLVGLLSRSDQFHDHKVDPLKTPGAWLFPYPHQDMEVAHPGKFESPRLNLAWGFVRRRHFQLGVGASVWFTWARSERAASPLPYTEFSQRLTLDARHVF